MPQLPVAQYCCILEMAWSYAGVQRQYTGTAGRVENYQVRSISQLRFGGWARADRPGAVPAAVVDRRSGPVPRGGYPGRDGVRDQAGVARVMIGRALDAGTPAGCVTAD